MPDESDEIPDAEVVGEPTAEEFAAAADLPENYFELYKLAVEMADRVSARRSLANSFFLTINTGLVALMGGADDLKWYLPVAGLLFCVTWWALLKSYRDLNSAKFQIILGMEERLPVRVYADEKRIYRSVPVRFQLRRKVVTQWISQYRELNRVERIVPVVFGAMYLAELIRQVVE
ncbi:MAG: RipA family octameric membrane protein [Solirubrobacteraceae bacterium]